MKKKHIILIVCLIGGFISFLTITKFKENEKDVSIILDRMLENKKGIYVFGFEDCPWCQQLYPVLDEVIKQKDEDVYYIDTHSNDFKENDRKNLQTYINENTGYEDIIVPLVVFISQDRYTQYHIGTVEGHDARKEYLSKNQTKDLKRHLNFLIYEYQKHN